MSSISDQSSSLGAVIDAPALSSAAGKQAAVFELFHKRRHRLDFLSSDDALGNARFRMARRLYEVWFWHAVVTLPRTSRFSPSTLSPDLLSGISFANKDSRGGFVRDIPANTGIFPYGKNDEIDDSVAFAALDRCKSLGEPVFFTVEQTKAGDKPARRFSGLVVPLSHDGYSVDRFCISVQEN